MRLPSDFGWPQNMTYGGSKPTLLNWLYGARLSTPSTLTVDTQQIGLGTAMDLKGFMPFISEKSLCRGSKCSILNTP